MHCCQVLSRRMQQVELRQRRSDNGQSEADAKRDQEKDVQAAIEAVKEREQDD